ncbi:hypothetical protein NS220_06475 [Microbacterium testaceum]|uniref:Uncharacterized protein n=1 Tax=Microbacterium testaceum TaxID=2033 RepID=A0A147EYN5_MICTE|nr:hypothetical protein NS220_06475 [Microbacterium testaceum]
MTAITCALRDASTRAAALGRKPSAAMAASTASRLAGLTLAAPVSTRDTVGTDTPARAATSAIVAGFVREGSIALRLCAVPVLI